MRSLTQFVSSAVVLLALAAPAWAVFPAGNPLAATIPTSNWSIELQDVVTIPNSSGLAPRLEFLTAGGAPGLAYIIDQRGKIYTFDPSLPSPTPNVFLDLATAVANFNSFSQTGLRGLAFHPGFNEPTSPGFRKFYAALSRDSVGPLVGGPVVFPVPGQPAAGVDNVVAEWSVNPDGTANPASYRELMRISQSFYDHQIGQIGFNPNAGIGDADYGNLYLALGDGGNTFPPDPIDPHNTGQNQDNVQGSILRIKPLASGNNSFTIPVDNPFRVDGTPSTARNTIWAYGFRNPHQFTFDRGGDHKMLIVDIGQSNIEEVNLGQAGGNYGWDLREGTFQTTAAFSGSDNLVDTLPSDHATDGFTYPVAQYDHDSDNNNNIEGAWSIAGGSVYRGMAVPELTGLYIFGEFATNSGAIYAVDVDDLIQRDDFSNLGSLYNGQLAPFVQLKLTHNGQEKSLLQIIRDGSGNQFLSRTDLRFGLGPDSEIYVLNKNDGRVRRIASTSGLLPGDYNNDGIVDGADYVVWRKNAGTNNLLPNNPTPGPIDQTEYDRWRSNFGAQGATGSASASQVPEPTTLLIAVGISLLIPFKRSARLTSPASATL